MRIYRQLPKIKALTFDLDDTLYDNVPVIQKVEQEMVKWMHHHHPVSSQWSLTQWQGLKMDLLVTMPHLAHDVTLWRQTQIEQGLKHLGYDDPKAKQASIDAIQQVLWWRNQIDVPVQTHHVMTQLAAAFPLIAITNGNADPHQIGLGHYFDVILKAGPDGRAKPYDDMFTAAQHALQLPAAHILHVGDHPVSDVQGAKLAGFQACWINDKHQSLYHTKAMRTLPDVEINDLTELLPLTKLVNVHD